MDHYERFRRAAVEGGIPEDAVGRFAEHLRFAIQARTRGDGNVVGQSGGMPRLPVGTRWPESASERPLPFIASLDCAMLPKVERLPLPADGSLLFFLDHEGAFNEDCCNRPEKPFARVLYVPSDAETAVAVAPSGHETYARSRETPFFRPELVLFARVVPELPAWLERDEDEDEDYDPLEFESDAVKQLAAGLSHAEELVALANGLRPAGQGFLELMIGGYTAQIGGSDPPETRMASRAIAVRRKAEPDRTRSEWARLEGEERQRLIREWVPLAQFPTDDEVYYGRFLIRVDDLAAGRFDEMCSYTAFTE